MTAKTPDPDAILDPATPLVHQQASELHPYGHIVALPIALSASARNEQQVWFVAEHLVDTPLVRAF